MLTLYNRQNLLPPAAPPSDPPPKPRAKFDLKLAQAKALGQQRRYTLYRTQLGDLALHWVESWWGGLFSIVDIATYLPGSRFFHPTDNHETIYAGDASAFCTTPWEWAGQPYGRSYDVWTGQKHATPFSEDPVLPYHGKAPLSQTLVGDTVNDHESEEVARWKSQRRRLPFWRQKQLALPGPNIGSDLSDFAANVTYVVMR